MKHCRLASAAVRVIFCFVDIVKRQQQRALSYRADRSARIVESYLSRYLLEFYSRVHIRFFAAVRCRTDRVGFQIESERKLETVEEIFDYLRAVHFCCRGIEHYEFIRIRGDHSVRRAVESERKPNRSFSSETYIRLDLVSCKIHAEVCLQQEINIEAERAEYLRHNVAGDIHDHLAVGYLYRRKQVSYYVVASRSKRFRISGRRSLIFVGNIARFFAEILTVEQVGKYVGNDDRIYTVEHFVEFVEKYRDERRTLDLQIYESNAAQSDVEVVSVAVYAQYRLAVDRSQHIDLEHEFAALYIPVEKYLHVVIQLVEADVYGYIEIYSQRLEKSRYKAVEVYFARLGVDDEFSADRVVAEGLLDCRNQIVVVILVCVCFRLKILGQLFFVDSETQRIG